MLQLWTTFHFAEKIFPLANIPGDHIISFVNSIPDANRVLSAFMMQLAISQLEKDFEAGWRDFEPITVRRRLIEKIILKIGNGCTLYHCRTIQYCSSFRPSVIILIQIIFPIRHILLSSNREWTTIPNQSHLGIFLRQQNFLVFPQNFETLEKVDHRHKIAKETLWWRK